MALLGSQKNTTSGRFPPIFSRLGTRDMNLMVPVTSPLDPVSRSVGESAVGRQRRVTSSPRTLDGRTAGHCGCREGAGVVSSNTLEVAGVKVIFGRRCRESWEAAGEERFHAARSKF